MNRLIPHSYPCVFCSTQIRPDEDHNEFDACVVPFDAADTVRFTRLGVPVTPVCALCFHTIDAAIATCVMRGIGERGAA